MQSTVCAPSSERCRSKSYMALPVPVLRVEIARNVTANRGRKRRELAVEARAAQVIRRRLREILVLPADRFRHVDIFDVRRTFHRGEHRRDHLAEAFRL